MPSATVPANAIALGPGYLYWAPLLSTLPTNTVSGSIFTDTWPGAWQLLGATDKGSTWDYELSTDTVDIAESNDPVAIVSTGRKTGLSADLAQIHMTNVKRALNGGTITVTGSGATQLNTYVPPDIGQEVRAMVGWEAQDSTERYIGYQTFQTGKLSVARQKGSAKSLLSCEFDFEKPAAGGAPFGYWTAGAIRG